MYRIERYIGKLESDISRIRGGKFVKYGTPVNFGFEVEEKDLHETRQLINCHI